MSGIIEAPKSEISDNAQPSGGGGVIDTSDGKSIVADVKTGPVLIPTAVDTLSAPAPTIAVAVATGAGADNTADKNAVIVESAPVQSPAVPLAAADAVPPASAALPPATSTPDEVLVVDKSPSKTEKTIPVTVPEPEPVPAKASVAEGTPPPPAPPAPTPSVVSTLTPSTPSSVATIIPSRPPPPPPPPPPFVPSAVVVTPAPVVDPVASAKAPVASTLARVQQKTVSVDGAVLKTQPVQASVHSNASARIVSKRPTPSVAALSSSGSSPSSSPSTSSSSSSSATKGTRTQRIVPGRRASLAACISPIATTHVMYHAPTVATPRKLDMIPQWSPQSHPNVCLLSPGRYVVYASALLSVTFDNADPKNPVEIPPSPLSADFAAADPSGSSSSTSRSSGTAPVIMIGREQIIPDGQYRLLSISCVQSGSTPLHQPLLCTIVRLPSQLS